MEQQAQEDGNKRQSNGWLKITIVIFSIFAIVFFLAGLTTQGVIPNYLQLEVLCSGWIKSELIKNDSSEYKEHHGPLSFKPVIYLYPEKSQKVDVQLDYAGSLIATYPQYDEKIKGWNVMASPDGTLINKADNKEYSYLFWEGKYAKNPDWDLSTGFVVRGSDTRDFLQNIFPKLGLTPREYNEFVVYWYPIMQKNPYNLIHFAGKEYTESAKLSIIPKPNSILRVFMVYKPLQEKIDIPEQKIEKFERKGFSVVEWGGTEVN